MTSTVAASVAVLAALNTITGVTIYEGDPPSDPPREDPGDVSSPVLHYACLYMGGGQPRADRHAHRATNLDLGFTVTAVSGTPRGALWTVDKVRAALNGLRLIAGLEHGRLREITEPSQRVRKDTDVPDDLRWYLPMQYRFATTTQGAPTP